MQSKRRVVRGAILGQNTQRERELVEWKKNPYREMAWKSHILKSGRNSVGTRGRNVIDLDLIGEWMKPKSEQIEKKRVLTRGGSVGILVLRVRNFLGFGRLLRGDVVIFDKVQSDGYLFGRHWRWCLIFWFFSRHFFLCMVRWVSCYESVGMQELRLWARNLFWHNTWICDIVHDICSYSPIRIDFNVVNAVILAVWRVDLWFRIAAHRILSKFLIATASRLFLRRSFREAILSSRFCGCSPILC